MSVGKNKIDKLQITAAVVAAAAVLTLAVVKLNSSSESAVSSPESSDASSAEQLLTRSENGKIYISSEDISEGISFLDYTASDGTAMQYILVKDQDGEIRGALNTCQVCNGSPYAYFVEDGGNVICQNCRNKFSIDVIGLTHGGCNPVPLEVTEENGEYIVDAEYLDSVSPAFSNWKKDI